MPECMNRSFFGNPNLGKGPFEYCLDKTFKASPVSRVTRYDWT